jgi:hypothetical protein
MAGGGAGRRKGAAGIGLDAPPRAPLQVAAAVEAGKRREWEAKIAWAEKHCKIDTRTVQEDENRCRPNRELRRAPVSRVQRRRGVRKAGRWLGCGHR